MKRTLFILGFIMIITSCKKPADVTEYAATITADELKEMLYVYASDEFEGRDTGQEGQKKAVKYLKDHYVGLDIEAALGDGNYFQEVSLQSLGTPNVTLSVNGKEFNYFEDYVSWRSSGSTTINATDVIYLGYGIKHDNHDDYKDVDVKGKVIVIKEGEPQNEDGTFKVSGTEERSVWSNGFQALRTKFQVANEAGAAAVFYMSDQLLTPLAQRAKRNAESGRGNGLSIVDPNANPNHNFIVNEGLAKKLVSNISSSDKVSTDANNVVLDYEEISEDVSSENVVAIIKGSEKPEEYVVISSHLDHIGVTADGQINYGADDDGSGTVALIEMAEAFKQAVENGHGPKRSIVFLHVTGEERGLLGSRYYTDVDPIFPLENTVADLNIDMIGRIDPNHETENSDYVYLIGSDKLSTELHTISEEVNTKYTNLYLDYTYNDENDPNRFYFRSDHWNFAKNNIPVIFYFNGVHPDYHRPTDTPDKIEYDLFANRTRLVFHTAWELANRENRIVVDKATE